MPWATRSPNGLAAGPIGVGVLGVPVAGERRRSETRSASVIVRAGGLEGLSARRARRSRATKRGAAHRLLLQRLDLGVRACSSRREGRAPPARGPRGRVQPVGAEVLAVSDSPGCAATSRQGTPCSAAIRLTCALTLRDPAMPPAPWSAARAGRRRQRSGIVGGDDERAPEPRPQASEASLEGVREALEVGTGRAAGRRWRRRSGVTRSGSSSTAARAARARRRSWPRRRPGSGSERRGLRARSDAARRSAQQRRRARCPCPR